MKKVLKVLFATSILVAFGMTVYGQSASATATVLAPLTVNKVNDMQFGNVTPGVTKSVSVTGTVIAGTASGTTESQASWTIAKGANVNVDLTLTLPANLINGVNNLAINYNDVGATKLGLLSNGTVPQDVTFTPSGAVMQIRAAGAYLNFFPSTNLTLSLGGTVVPTGGQVAAVYTGTITLAAVYN